MQQASYNQIDQLNWLREKTGMEWVPMNPLYARKCAKRNDFKVPIVAMESYEPEFNYYIPEASYCTIDEYLAAAIVNMRDEGIWNVMPSLKYDFNVHPPVIVSRHFPRFKIQITATAQFEGDIIMHNVFHENPWTVSSDFQHFQTNASRTKDSFVETFKFDIVPSGAGIEKIGLGYSTSNKNTIWNTSLKINSDMSFTASANPEPIRTAYNDWKIEGQLGFSMSGRIDHVDTEASSSFVLDRVKSTMENLFSAVKVATALKVYGEVEKTQALIDMADTVVDEVKNNPGKAVTVGAVGAGTLIILIAGKATLPVWGPLLGLGVLTGIINTR